jgi:hypothetical protein
MLILSFLNCSVYYPVPQMLDWIPLPSSQSSSKSLQNGACRKKNGENLYLISSAVHGIFLPSISLERNAAKAKDAVSWQHVCVCAHSPQGAHAPKIHREAKSCSIVFSHTQLNNRHPSARKNQFSSARFFAISKCAHHRQEAVSPHWYHFAAARLLSRLALF